MWFYYCHALNIKLEKKKSETFAVTYVELFCIHIQQNKKKFPVWKVVLTLTQDFPNCVAHKLTGVCVVKGFFQKISIIATFLRFTFIEQLSHIVRHSLFYADPCVLYRPLFPRRPGSWQGMWREEYCWLLSLDNTGRQVINQ